MNIKKALSLLTAAALSIGSFAALAVTASADTLDYGTKTTGADGSVSFNVGADSMTWHTQGDVVDYGATNLKITDSLSDKKVNDDYIAELTFQSIDSLASFDAVDVLVGCNNNVQLTVKVGGTEVAKINNINNGDWSTPKQMTAELTDTNATGTVTLYLKNLTPDSNHYMGNYVSVTFYDRSKIESYGSVYDDDDGSKIFGFNGNNSVIQYWKLGTPKEYKVNENTYSIPDSIQGKNNGEGTDSVAILQMHYVDLSKNNFGKAVICMGNGNTNNKDYTVTLKVGDTKIATFTNINTNNDWKPHEQDEVNINNHTAKGYVTLTINHYSESYAGNYAYVKFIPRTEFSSSGEIAKGTAESKLSSTGSSYQRFNDEAKGEPADAYLTSIDLNSKYTVNGLKWYIYKPDENNNTTYATIDATSTALSGSGTVYFGLVITGLKEDLDTITKVELK